MRHGCQRGLQVVDVAPHRRLAAVADRAGADQRHRRCDGAAEHRGTEVVFVVFRKRRDLGGEELSALLRPRLEPVQALADIGEEAGLRLFAVAHYVDAAFSLFRDAFGHGGADTVLIDLLAVLATLKPSLHHVEQVVRSRQTADMRRHDPIGVLLQRHRRLQVLARSRNGSLGRATAGVNDARFAR